LRRQGVGAEDAGAMETLVQVAEGHPLLLGLAVSWLRQEAGGMIDRAGLDFFAGLFQKYRGDAEAKVEEIFSRLFEDLPERLQPIESNGLSNGAFIVSNEVSYQLCPSTFKIKIVS
jgi:hypothetical protein